MLSLEKGSSAGLAKGRVVVIGGGAAGLVAAWTFRKRGVDVVLLEANDWIGGRMGGDGSLDGFLVDRGADFFPSSYDVVFRVCEELGLPLMRTQMDIGWYKNGRWSVTTPSLISGFAKNLKSFWHLEFTTPAGLWPAFKLVRSIRRDAKYLNYRSDHRIAELDTEETYGEYLDRLRIPRSLRVTLEGFLGLTMGHVERFGATWVRTFLGEVLLKPTELRVPERGCSSLSNALADACGGDVIRTSAPVRRVVIRDGMATSVITDDEEIDVDAVICTAPATKVPEIIPDLSAEIHRALDKVTYSSGIRVAVGLDRRPLPPGWSVAIYPEDDTPSLLDRTINLPLCAPPGKHMLDLWVGKDRAKELLTLDDAEIVRRLLADARRKAPPGSAIPGENELLFSRVYRHHDAVCMCRPGMLTAMVDMRRQLKEEVGNLVLAGDYTRSPIVNGAMASGIDAAEEIANLLERRYSRQEA